MAKNDANEMQRPLRCVDLAEDVSWDLYHSPNPPKHWRFLAKDGTYMREKMAGSKVADPITAHGWPMAVEIANRENAAFIVVFHKRHVLFPVRGLGAASWWPATAYPHPSLKVMNHATVDRYEPDPNRPKGLPKKRPSGAQLRKRRKERAWGAEFDRSKRPKESRKR